MLVILIGPPGAGKGTQSKRLASHLGIVHCSTGDLFRQASHEDSEIGREAHEYMVTGRLVPDALVQQIVDERLSQEDCKAGCLLDGFPRTLVQAIEFDEWTRENYQPISTVIEFQVDEQALLDRLGSRGRADDDRQVIHERFRHYEELTTPLLDYYDQQGLLTKVDGNGGIDEVFERIKSVFQTTP